MITPLSWQVTLREFECRIKIHSELGHLRLLGVQDIETRALLQTCANLERILINLNNPDFNSFRIDFNLGSFNMNTQSKDLNTEGKISYVSPP